MDSSLHETVFAWLQTSYWNQLISYEPVELADTISKKACAANAQTDSSQDYLGAKNMSALAAWALAEAALAHPEGSVERTAIVAAVGYLLANIRASHQTYLHPVVFPFGNIDLELLDRAEETYNSLVPGTLRANAKALDHVRPMSGTIQIHVRAESGHYEPTPNKGMISDPPAPWTGTWAAYPLK